MLDDEIKIRVKDAKKTEKSRESAFLCFVFFSFFFGTGYEFENCFAWRSEENKSQRCKENWGNTIARSFFGFCCFLFFFSFFGTRYGYSSNVSPNARSRNKDKSQGHKEREKIRWLLFLLVSIPCFDFSETQSRCSWKIRNRSRKDHQIKMMPG